MKPMIYTYESKKEILYEGEYKGFHFLIVTYGRHPCAYVEIPKDHPYYDKDYNSLDINVHGGITWGDPLYQFEDKRGWYIGWDYIHLDDYDGIWLDPRFEKYDAQDILLQNKDKKKWTTEEIFEDVKSVIAQLHKVSN